MAQVIYNDSPLIIPIKYNCLIKKQFIETNLRDEIIRKLKQLPENDKCFDCEKKNTKWASITLGLFLCIDCAAKHRSYGPTISFVRSLTLDEWDLKQITSLELGGNQKALEFFRRNGSLIDNQRSLDYRSTTVQKYKEELSKSVKLQLAQIAISQKTEQELLKKQEEQSQKQPTQSDTIQNNLPKQLPEEKKVNEKPEEKFANNLTENNVKVQSSKVIFNTQASKKQTGGKGKMKAEKIDIDFDKLNFEDESQVIDNKRQEQESKTMTQPEFKLYEEENQEQKQKPIQTFQQPSEYQQKQNTDALDKMKKSNNVKAISSASLFGPNDNEQDKQQYKKFTGQTAISSKQFFGNGPDDDSNPGTPSPGQNFEAVKNFFQEKMEIVKDKTVNYIEKVKESWK